MAEVCRVGAWLWILAYFVRYPDPMTGFRLFNGRLWGSRSYPQLASLACLLFFASSVAAQEASYRIGPKDVVSIRVEEREDHNFDGAVAEDGTVLIAKLGPIPIANLTTREAAAAIRRALLGRLLRKATVSVVVKEFLSKAISVTGAVEKPGSIGYASHTTLVEAIAEAGGLTPSHGSVVYVLRTANNGLSQQIEIPVQPLMVNGEPRYNIPIFPNDIIRVAASSEVTIYFLGAVNQPGPVTFKDKDRITLLTAIASAGGLTDRASPKITVRRKDPRKNSSREIAVNYKNVIRGKAPDFQLEEGDVIVVKESFF